MNYMYASQQLTIPSKSGLERVAGDLHENGLTLFYQKSIG